MVVCVRINVCIVVVIGFVGKMGIKEVFCFCLELLGKVYVFVVFFNNYWGVLLIFVRMLVDIDFGVFEIGMNYVGEIMFFVKMVCLYVVIIISV